ncbi:ParB-like protein [Vibrio sp. SCSIO 43135]|uniref:ParB-like protein n=1 Tax=Vibrio sp. SCSIO 43135 TaxID=2819096 RepID=UPI0020758305|nr:ParB-like protein [Vibrio sp. SCSIO 43135]
MKKLLLLSLSIAASMPLHAQDSTITVGDVLKVPLADLKPTQPSIGYDQVFYKLGRYQFDVEKQFDEICEAQGQKGVKHFSEHSVPSLAASFSCEEPVASRAKDLKTVVIGPDDALYLTDGHHTFNTFYHMNGGGAGFNVQVRVDGDYRQLESMDEFWQAMEKDGNTWLYDHNNVAIRYNDLPSHLGMYNFNNDVYRSLMYFSRDIAWNKPKQPVPFLEFYWSKELRQLTDAQQYDLNSMQGYKQALEDVGKHLLSIDSDNVGGSKLSAEQMGIYPSFKQKGLDKVSRENGKLDYMLRYKTSSTGNGIAYDSAVISPTYLKKVDDFTLEMKRSFTDFPPSTDGNTVNAIVEIPTGTSAKWELSKENENQLIWEYKNGAPRVVEYLGYPGNYGTIPQTALPKELGGDGDPLDVLVLGQAVPRGEVVSARLIGVLKMLDGDEQDDKLIAVLTNDSPFSGVESLTELDERFIGVKDIVKIWFESYKGKDGGMEVIGWGDEKEAGAILNQSESAYITSNPS